LGRACGPDHQPMQVVLLLRQARFPVDAGKLAFDADYRFICQPQYRST
jgi:hypothetical protein